MKNKKKKIVLALVMILTICSMCLAGCAEKQLTNTSSETYTSYNQLNKKGVKIGYITGMAGDKELKEVMPNVEIKYYDSYADMILALKEKQIDGFADDYPSAKYRTRHIEGTAFIDKQIQPIYDIAFAFGKTEFSKKIRAQFDEYLEKVKSDGSLYDMLNEWYDGKKDDYIVDVPKEGKNGTIEYAINAETPPVVYVSDGEYTGLEIEIAANFCKEYGYGMNIHDMKFGSIIPGITAGHYQMSSSYIAITKERSEVIDFSEPYISTGTVVVVAQEIEGKSFFDQIGESFYKTFIKENRWELILQGIKTTMVISLCSAIAGTILGFGICMLRRKKNRITRGITTVYIRILQGMPQVVLLLVMFYLVFAKAGFSGEVVAIIAFALNFSAYTSEIMRSGIDSIDNGQREAALALGYTKAKAFIKVIMPQAIKRFLPVYKGELISLVKTTSVVGYIAVADLTKIGDIIRSRTYEAFFPLITIAIIYFLLAFLLTSLLNAVEIKLGPKRKKKMLKGVRL